MKYSDLSDADLLQRVRGLMGYEVDSNENEDGVPPFGYWLMKNGNEVPNSFGTKAEAWQRAPDYLNDANAWMRLVDEIRLLDMQVTITVDDRQSSAMAETRYAEFASAISSPKNPGRAICEVFCQVMEQK